MKKTSLRLIAAVLSASTCLGVNLAYGENANPAPVADAVLPQQAPVLRRFGLSPDELVFSGENGSRDVPIYVAPLETAKASQLVLMVSSAVSVLPEASEMIVLVNDAVVGRQKLGESEVTKIAIDLAPGVLQPGYNSVSLVVTQTHRVDCSVPATYELWSRVDAQRSGILFPADQAQIDTFADLPGFDRNAEGRFVIRGRIAQDASREQIANTLSAIESVVVSGKLQDPIVEFNEFPGTGAGLDVSVGASDAAAPNASSLLPFASFIPATAGQRAQLLISGGDAGAIKANLTQFAQYVAQRHIEGSPAGLRALRNRAGQKLDAGQAVKFADLGFREQNFAGRFLRDRVAFNLPADFYAADYADAAINLEAAYAPNLLGTAQLLVRANGQIVSTLSLSSVRGGTLSKQRLPIPLSKLRPGTNAITLEAYVPAASDLVCDTISRSSEPRLFISGDTTLQIPTIARVGHGPDVAATMAGVSQINGARPLSVFAPKLRGKTLDAVGTFIARMAGAAETTFPLDFIDAPSQSTGEAIAFGEFSSLPSDLLSYVGVHQAGPAVTTIGATENPPLQIATSASDWLQFGAGQDTEGTNSKPSWNLSIFNEPVDVRARLDEFAAVAKVYASYAIDRAWRLIRPAEDENGAQVQISEGTALVMAQRPAPQISTAAWTVVAASSDGDLLNGVEKITGSGQWGQLGGAISLLNKGEDTVTVMQATGERLFETQPRSLQNGRLILAGWFSRHMERYVLGILAVFLLLGMTTHLFVRRIGRKRQ